MRRGLTIAVLTFALSGPVAWAEGEDMTRRVLSGDRIVVKGVTIRLMDTECPAPGTEEAQEAKRIVRIMLFARKLQCTYDAGPDGNVGDCIYGPSASSRVGRSMAEELKRRNLCQPFGRT